MLLFLLRHAEAEPCVTSDADRVLTPKGIEQAAVVGAFCRRRALRPALVLTSPYSRTVQTGQIVAAELGEVPRQSDAFLASGMEPETAFTELRAYRHLESLLLVGHQPDLGILAAALLGMKDPGNIPFKLASLVGLRVERFATYGGSLELFVPLAHMRVA